MGEKHDGVRFCWNMYENRLYPYLILPAIYYIN